MPQIKTGTILTHITGWLIFMGLPLVFLSGENSNERVLGALGSSSYWLFFFCFAFIFYFHTYVLFPELYAKKKYRSYGILIAVMFALICLIKPFDRLIHFMGPDRGLLPEGPYGHRPPPFEGDPHERGGPIGEGGHRRRGPGGSHLDIFSIILYILTITLSIAVNLSREWRLSRQRALLAEKGKAQAELAILKAQIQPHFLFNTLNNIYALAITQQPNTAESIMKLSNILRYVTEEAGEKFVSLNAEINCIRDYIDLQRLRLGDKTSLSILLPEHTRGMMIAPMILMTFIENAFKFGISSHENTVITISIYISERSILFFCSNKLPAKHSNEGERLGIGINNTKQRLEHLYKDNYSLEIEEGPESYTVKLKITTSITDKNQENAD